MKDKINVKVIFAKCGAMQILMFKQSIKRDF